MLEHTSVCMFACARMLITFGCLLFVCVCTVYYMCVCARVCVVPPGSHLREWSAAARLSLAEAPRVDALERERTRARPRRTAPWVFITTNKRLIY